MHRGASRDPVKKQQLIRCQPQCRQHLNIKFFDSLIGESTDFRIQQRTPPQHSHYQFGGQAVVRGRQLRVLDRV
jgi:hypothetical protein